jgi:site-specific DNA recombinase
MQRQGAKIITIGSVSRIPAADIEAVVVKFVQEHLATKQDKSTTGAVRLGDRGDLEQLVAGIVVCKDRTQIG